MRNNPRIEKSPVNQNVMLTKMNRQYKINFRGILLFMSLFSTSYAYSFQFTLSLEDSIAIAKEHIEKNDINVSNHFLSKAEFLENCTKGMCWKIVWRYRS